MTEKKSCEDCIFLKSYLNQKEMLRQGKDEESIIWKHMCDHPKTPGVVKDLNVAESCSFYDEDSIVN